MKLLNNLTVRVLIAITLGILTGYFFPETAAKLKPLGDIFINLIKMVIAPIIFLTIVLGISNMGDLKKVGRVGGKALLYFEIVTTGALAIGLILANLIRPGDGVQNGGRKGGDISKYTEQGAGMDWTEFFIHIVPSNAIKAFAEGEILQVLVFSVLFGVGLTRMGETGTTADSDLRAVVKSIFQYSECGHGAGTHWGFWRDGLHHWQIWPEYVVAAGQTDGNGVCYYDSVHFCDPEPDSTLLQNQFVDSAEVHQRRIADCAGHVLVGVGAAADHGQTRNAWAAPGRWWGWWFRRAIHLTSMVRPFTW